MEIVNDFPSVMDHAYEDLAGHLPGRFSPQDWEKIRLEARRRWHIHRQQMGDDLSAWQQVIREFANEKFWGFRPEFEAPSPLRWPSINLGISFILLAMQAFIFSIMAVVWLGQIHTASDEAFDTWLFYFVVAVVVANFAFFLWRHREHAD